MKVLKSLFKGRDLDDVFAYETLQIQLIKHKIMATVAWILSLSVVAYTVIYVLLILQQYQITYPWTGTIFFSVAGKGYSEDSGVYTVWDAGDLVYPDQDSSSINIGLKTSEVKGQYMGYCTTECTEDSDCEYNPPFSYESCIDGYCEELNWCPLATSDNMVNSTITGVEDFELNVFSLIDFPQFDGKTYLSYSSRNTTYPDSGATQFLVKDILAEVGIEDISEIEDEGALIEMIFEWECNSSKNECIPSYKYSELNTKDDINTIERTIHYYNDDGELRRDYRTIKNLKIIFDSSGKISKFSFHNIMIQLASMMALLGLMASVADCILKNYPVADERQKFNDIIQEMSVDFSDKKDRIDYIKFLSKRREEQKEE